MSTALEAKVVRDQKLTTPNGSVGSVAGPIQRYPDDLAFNPVLGHATGDMSMMVLYGHGGKPGMLQGPPCAQVLRVQIERHRARLNPKQFLELVQRLFEKEHGLVVFRVADMLAQDGVAIFGQTERTLQLRSAGEDLGHGCTQINRLGCVSAGTP